MQAVKPPTYRTCPIYQSTVLQTLEILFSSLFRSIIPILPNIGKIYARYPLLSGNLNH